jgi:hypothetical protein
LKICTLKTGQPGTLKDFQDFTQVERFSDALWEHGLQSIDSSNFLEELNKKLQNFKKQINQQKTRKSYHLLPIANSLRVKLALIT